MSLTKSSSRKDLTEQNQYQNQNENQNQPKSTTIVKYEKSSCLFCNEWFDAQTFTVIIVQLFSSPLITITLLLFGCDCRNT